MESIRYGEHEGGLRQAEHKQPWAQNREYFRRYGREEYHGSRERGNQYGRRKPYYDY